MDKAKREELHNELNQLRVKRSIDKGSWFAHKSYAEELIHTLGASGDSLMKEADVILKKQLKPTAERIKELEYLLQISPEKRVNTSVVSSMGL